MLLNGGAGARGKLKGRAAQLTWSGTGAEGGSHRELSAGVDTAAGDGWSQGPGPALRIRPLFRALSHHVRHRAALFPDSAPATPPACSVKGVHAEGGVGAMGPAWQAGRETPRPATCGAAPCSLVRHCCAKRREGASASAALHTRAARLPAHLPCYPELAARRHCRCRSAGRAELLGAWAAGWEAGGPQQPFPQVGREPCGGEPARPA